MATRNVLLGGTDWTSENPTSADMNDTNDAIVGKLIKKDVMTEDTTEYSNTTSEGSGSTIKYWTFTPTNANNIILGIRVESDVKYSTTDAGVTGDFLIGLTNVTSGTEILLGGPYYSGDVDNLKFQSLCWEGTTAYVSKDTYFVLHDRSGEHNYNQSIDIGKIGNTVTCGMDGTSYRIAIKVIASSGSSDTGTVTGYCDNTTITIYYFDGMQVTTASAKFS